MAETTITTKAKKKMLEARAGIAALPKIVGMVFGDGGVDERDEIVPHSPDQNLSLIHISFLYLQALVLTLLYLSLSSSLSC